MAEVWLVFTPRHPKYATVVSEGAARLGPAHHCRAPVGEEHAVFSLITVR